MRDLWKAMAAALLVLTTICLSGCGDGIELAGQIASYEELCEGGDLDSCIELAVMYMNGETRPPPEPLPINEDGQRVLVLDDCGENIGECLRQHSRDEARERETQRREDLDGAAEYFRRACELGDPQSCYDTGVMHSGALYLRYEPNTMRRYYDLSCEMGWAYACSELHDFDNNIVRNRFVLPDGAVTLGSFEVTVTANPAPEGRAALQADCDGGDASDCLFLGASIFHGETMPLNEELGVQLISRACNLGSEQACSFGIERE